jgi:hypothetical protein
MSCYNWERGTIRIPAGAWAKFRGDLLRAWNNKQDDLFKRAKRAYAAAKAAAKGKRGKSRQKAIDEAVARSSGGHLDEYGDFRGFSDSSQNEYEAICDLVLKVEGWGDNRKVTLQAPKKRDLAKVKISGSCTLNLPDAIVSFNNTTKSVTWDVPENNRAREHAREHWFAHMLFTALRRIKWTRNSGGTIVGNDEYNRDESDYEGGGGNYVVVTYRKPTAEDRRREARMRQQRSRSYAW